MLEVQEYARTWGVSLAAAQPGIPGAVCEVFTQAPPGTSDVDTQDIWITATSQNPSGSITLRLDRKTALRISRATGSGNAEAVADLTDGNRASLLECVRQAAAGVNASAPHEGKGEFQVEFQVSHAENKAVVLWLQFRGDAGDPAVVEFWLDNAILQSLLSPNKSPSPSPKSVVETAESKLGMLMDVELSVAVRFGGRRMLLKDILDLCAGSVVELDQQVQQPVDLLLDGKLIARGEVVVVGGNYGLRVSEVLSGPPR
jgi:flagellar motor switch protein FliN/FliY